MQGRDQSVNPLIAWGSDQILVEWGPGFSVSGSMIFGRFSAGGQENVSVKYQSVQPKLSRLGLWVKIPMS